MRSLMSYINESDESFKKTTKQKQEYKQGITLLDQSLNNEKDAIENIGNIFRPNGPCIYAFITDKVKDSIKIGFTDQHPEKRIAQWAKIYGEKEGEVVTLGYWSAEEFNEVAKEKVFFWDHEVHKKVAAKGYKNVSKEEFYRDFLTDIGKEVNAVKELHYSSEFFTKYKYLLNGELNSEDREELSEELIKDIIIEMHEAIKRGEIDFKTYKFGENGKLSSQRSDQVWKGPDRYSNTDLQNEAIANGLKALKEGKKNLLMAAVMRFGKTHACYEIVNQSPDINKVVVVSAKADVRDAWRSDINHVHFYKNFAFVEIDTEHEILITQYDKNLDKLITKHTRRFNNIGRVIGESLEDEFEELKGKKLILFSTLQDLGGSLKEIKKKHIGIFDDDFDLMIVDETHYGSHAKSFGQLTGLGYDEDEFGDVKQEIKEYESDRKKIDSININYRHVLQVSGTPYYILASNEMIKEDAEVISKVSYTDMLQARDEWANKPGNKNKKPEDSPYFGIPTLHRIGLRLTNDCQKIMKENGVSASMKTLFTVDENCKFVHEKEIYNLVKAIFGDGSQESLSFLKNKKVEGNKVCKHTMVVLPRISACIAMRELMNGLIDTKNRQVMSIVGNDFGKADVRSIEDLNNTLEDLEKNNQKSIVLTVNRFLTGVSMPLIDSMIFMKDSSSPQEYDQAIFRLCTRCVRKIDNPGKGMPKVINMKENVYLVDFNIDNMYNMLANSARMQANVEKNPHPNRVLEIMNRNLKFTPLYTENTTGEILNKMKEVNADDLMEVYSNFNKNKTISDIITDDIENIFGPLFFNKGFQSVMGNIDIDRDNSISSRPVANMGDETSVNVGSVKGKGMQTDTGLKNFINKKLTGTDRKEMENARDKFKAIAKQLLCFNICLPTPYTAVSDILKDGSKIEGDLKKFRIDNLGVLEAIYNAMDPTWQQRLNDMLLKTSLLAQNMQNTDEDKFYDNMQKLGRFGKNEVPTPEPVIRKMISKLDAKDFENAESILIVNSKYGEFVRVINKEFGSDVARKCRVVCSSEMAEVITKKMFSTLKKTKGSFYDNINTNIKENQAEPFDFSDMILNIGDVNGDKKYDVNDFLEMKNEDILKMNGGKKFDICMMNPPYDKSLHLKFLKKVIEVTNEVISIQPTRWIEEATAKYNKKSAQIKYEDSISKHISDLEIISAEQAKEEFGILNTTNLGIFVCNEKGGFDYKSLSTNEIVDRVVEYIQNNKCNFEFNKKDGYRVRVPFISGGRAVGSGKRPPTLANIPLRNIVYKDGKYKDKWWYEYYTRNQYSKTTEEITSSIKFDSEQEGYNFIKSLETDFGKYIEDQIITDVNISNTKILWMGNAKHPRTGTIGYIDEWTNEDFYKFFELTPEEQNTVETFINNFDEKRSKWFKDNGK